MNHLHQIKFKIYVTSNWSVEHFAVAATWFKSILSVISENLRYGFSKYTAQISTVALQSQCIVFGKLSKDGTTKQVKFVSLKIFYPQNFFIQLQEY